MAKRAVHILLVEDDPVDAESIIRGIEAGANDYLPKPILHHDLVSKVRSMLGTEVTP